MSNAAFIWVGGENRDYDPHIVLHHGTHDGWLHVGFPVITNPSVARSLTLEIDATCGVGIRILQLDNLATGLSRPPRENMRLEIGSEPLFQ